MRPVTRQHRARSLMVSNAYSFPHVGYCCYKPDGAALIRPANG
ncbi:hypothetical protein CKO_03795 [Citrobacter koseri ATCC BAA-895]|uniref:Uncharacterized protein n=1 Tax=Citrobacter koseri (strain ATCC BAA-895 / CDC 4225-83 / SGSC4696) TaxID=290338 RepID=A8AN07_CITK8|nr:hypothetical protein CKO_03795 [Citrobacter koseri ATCC BAA-895]